MFLKVTYFAQRNDFTPVWKNIFVDELCFCQETLYRLLQPGCPVISVPGQYNARCSIIELHCLETVFVGQAILSSDYFVH